MRTLLATLVLVPSIALAQAPLPPPTDGGGAAPPPHAVRPVRRLGKQVLPPPTAGAATATVPGTPGEIEGGLTPGGDPIPVQAVPPPAAGSPQAGSGPGRPGRAFGGPRGNRNNPAGAPPARRIPTVQPPPPAAPTGQPGGEATITPVEGRCVPLQGRFMLAFNKADIVDVLEQASRWTCRNFIYTEDIARGKITLLSKTPVTAEEAYSAFLASLAANNIVIYPTGKYYKLGRAPDSKKLPIPTYTDPNTGVPASEQYVTKVIKLQSTDADMLRGVLGNFISPQGADIQSIPPDTLIITDIGVNIRRIEKILESVDRSGNADVIRVIQVRYAAAKDIADKLNQIFQAQGQGRKGIAAARPSRGGGMQPPPPPPGGAVQPQQGGADIISVSKVLADDRTNKLIVIADDRSFARVQELLDQLDVPTGADGGIHVVFLRNASAEELAQTLSNLAQGQTKRQNAGPGGAPGQFRGVPGAPGAVAPQGGAPEASTAELFSGEVKVTADKSQNALLIQASGADFAAMNRLIQKLDRPRRQVFVEAVIMEVQINDETKFGVGAHGVVDVTVNGKKGALPLVSRPDPTISSLDVTSLAKLGGFLTGFQGPTSGVLKDLTGFEIPSLGVLVQAMQSSNNVNVIATPTILATDNQEAEITVNDKIPYQSGIVSPSVTSLLGSTSSSTSSSTLGSLLGAGGLTGLTSQIQHEDVQLRLKMKPQINEGGNVRLTLELEKDDKGATDPTLGPSFLKRTVKSDIVAKDQGTIVIGGLIQETESRAVSKVPVLGSLPVLGALFRSTDTVKNKTNLLVFLTPYIIRDDGDYRRIFEKKQKELAQFRAQFYGKRKGYEPDIDFSRKASPLSRIHQGVVEETSRAENGGPGLPGEGVARPPQAEPPASDRSRSGKAPAAPPAEPQAQPMPPAEIAPPQPGEPVPAE